MENEFQEQYIPGLKNNQSRLFFAIVTIPLPKVKKKICLRRNLCFIHCIILRIIMHCNINIKKLCLFSSRIWGRKSKKKIEGGGERIKNLELYTPLYWEERFIGWEEELKSCEEGYNGVRKSLNIGKKDLNVGRIKDSNGGRKDTTLGEGFKCWEEGLKSGNEGLKRWQEGFNH